ncbi:hypothetical protein DXG03_001041 [Asterophora parasitica]|uniref:Uncharacterized protein n=1 Tax=Asterophora parasitica TaxID=117018 RepID=A0A9P7G3V8_9AGAR|nr:hypothetical protein DXG03_001041 [Asterophora parasitica]
MDDSSSLYPSDSTPPLPEYQKHPEGYPPAPSYYDSESSFDVGDLEHASAAAPASSPHRDEVDSSEVESPGSGRDMDSSPYGGYAYPSNSDLSYAESIKAADASGLESRRTTVSPVESTSVTLPLVSHPINPVLPSSQSQHYDDSTADQYLSLEDSGAPGPSNLVRRATAVLHDIMYGGQERGALELHDELDEEYWDDDDEPDRFINFSLLSHLAVQLRDRVPRGTHVKGSIPYPRAFTGKDIVSTIQSQIARELQENHCGSNNDRRAALHIARSLQSQLMFYEVEWGGRILQDGVEDVYMFLDDEEGGSNAPREALPTSVVTILTRCYSPSCGEGPECYAYGCPRKGDSLRNLLPIRMETSSGAVREAWPKTVSPEVLRSLSETEINRQIIIHKLISKEEQFIQDLDLVDTVFIQPLRRANPPVITPSDRLESFIESVFHNIIELRECNRRLLDVLNVRQREEAPLIGDIGDILLGVVATEFRESYPEYIGNHPLAERRMKDELENNPEFRLLIEQCSRQQSVRHSSSLRLDLRHYLNRPSEHLQKYPVLLQAICKATPRGKPDEGFLKAAIEAIKDLQSVAQLRTFQSAMGRGATSKWEWKDLVSPDTRQTCSPDEIKRQSLIFEFVKVEMVNADPPIIPLDRLDRFIKDVFHNFAQLLVHHRALVNRLHIIQSEAHPKIKSITAAVYDAVLNFREAYLAYIPNYPIAAYRIEEEMEQNPTFKNFAEADARRLSMRDFLNCPLPHLLKYVELLRAILDVTPRGHEDLREIPPVIEVIEDLARETEPGVVSSKQKVQLWKHSSDLVFRPGETVDLDLFNESRSLVHTGKLFRQRDSSSGGSGWNEIFVVLFDNYLVVTEHEEDGGISRYHVQRRPIPLELLTLVKFDDRPTQSATVRSQFRSGGTSSGSASSNSGSLSDSGDSHRLYPFTIHHSGRSGGPIILYAESSATRGEWKEKLEEATGLRKVVQDANKVFESENLSVQTFSVAPLGHAVSPPTLGDSNPITGQQLFAYHIEALVPTPQHHSNASQTPQKLSGSKEVHFFSVGKLLERTFVIFMRKKGSDSHFHVLEPVLEKIHERPRAPTGMFQMFRSPKQEWFRTYKEFFLSVDTYDLFFLKARLAILSAKGFEIMDLNNSSSTPIPIADPSLAPVLQRCGTSRPIGIFRSREHEFLLCYSEFGIYVDKQGYPNRNTCIIEWEGTVDAVAFHPPYVMLFDQRFVEIRHYETGRLAQIIPGQDIRCIWDGRPHDWNSATPGITSDDEMVQEAHVHAVMNHPDAAVLSPGRPLRLVPQHAIDLGDVFVRRYRVLNKLGYGTFATVWLVEDFLLMRFAALKVLIAGLSERDRGPASETAVSKRLKEYQEQNPDAPGAEHVVKILDLFKIDGPNGTHRCIVTELLGPSLDCDDYIFIDESSDLEEFPPYIARRMRVQIAHGLAYLHKCGIVHGDLHKGNVPLYRKWSDDGIRRYFGKPVFEPYYPLRPFVPTPHMPTRLVQHWSLNDKDLFLSSVDTVHVGDPSSPEIFFHKVTLPGPPTDIWALAVLFYMSRRHNNALFYSTNSVDDNLLIKSIVSKLNPKICSLEYGAPVEELGALEGLLRQMVQYELSERITAEEVVRLLLRNWTEPGPED